MINPFFKNNGPFKLSEILDKLNLNIEIDNTDQSVLDIDKDYLSNFRLITYQELLLIIFYPQQLPTT